VLGRERQSDMNKTRLSVPKLIRPLNLGGAILETHAASEVDAGLSSGTQRSALFTRRMSQRI